MRPRRIAAAGPFACFLIGALAPARAQEPTLIGFEDQPVGTRVDTQYLQLGLRVSFLAVIGAAGSLAAAGQALRRKPPLAVWTGMARAVGRALQQALDVNIADVLVGGWNTYHSLLEYTDPAKHPPEEVASVTLWEHTITSSHEPRVKLLVNGENVATITFGVDLELHFDSATLTIQDGKILEVRTGTCVGKGTLKCEGAVLMERSSAEIPLPGRLTFGAGIPIRPGRS